VHLSQVRYGPSLPPPAHTKTFDVPWEQFFSAVLDVRDFLANNHQVPDALWLGSTPVPPEDYLVALAYVSARLATGQNLPKTVTIAPAELTAAEHVANDSVKIWDWPIFPDGFHSEHLMEIARLQAWTLKPAILTRQPLR
jgi:hypothetical protein